jgi:hypothetical protein
MLKTVSSVTNAIGALNYKGTWNATTNTPTITSSVGVKGDYYQVSVAGSTTINGISNWGVGDVIAFNGVVWQRIEGGADLNGVNLSVSGTTTLSGLTASTALALNAGKDVVSVTNTGTDNNVLSTSPSITTPRVITSINDTNGNELIGVTATASAVNEITMANAATTNSPTISATGSDTNIDIRFEPKGTGDVTVVTGNLVIGTSGKGIDFSATASGSGTMTSELLTDYEEGTWTPSLGGNTTYTSRSGTYVKIGRQVTAYFLVQVNTLGTGSATTISGLPFTSGADNLRGMGSITYFDSIATSNSWVSPYVGSNGTDITFLGQNAIDTTSVDAVSIFTNSAYILGAVQYLA